jgi:4-aminobutyrate aminotransferase
VTSDLERRAKRVLSPLPGRYTWLPLERGEGSWLITKDGRRVLDLTCGIAVTNVGHAHPRVVRAVSEQAAKLMHISTGVASYEPNIALAEALTALTPRGLDTVFFGNSGAEAVEAAIKLSRQHTKRQAIIAFRGSFHGRTAGALTLTTSKSSYRLGYGAMLPEVYVAPFPYALMCPIKPAHNATTCAEHCLAELETMLEHEVPPEHVAAILIEPVLGEGGYVAPPSSFLVALRELATRIGALLVMDEVQTGFGRTGAWFATQKHGVDPDILVLAKALGGGLPLGAIVTSHEMQQKWISGTHGSTFGGNPVSCAAGLASLEIIRDEGLVARAERLGELMVNELAPLRADRRVREIRRFGAMVAIEFDAKATAKAAIAGALERDVLLITCGVHDQAVRFIPALNIAEDDLRHGVRALVAAVNTAEVATPA